ncbi:MAG: aquaporin [Candidatus Eisenbacteria bacterium]
MNERERRDAAVEGLATGLLVLAVVGSGIMAERLADGNLALALLANALATGGALFGLITVFAPLSGAHLNPVVTLSALARGRIATRPALLYVAAQVGGGLAGVALANGLFGEPWLAASHGQRAGLDLFASEVVATFALVLLVAGLADRSAAVAGAVVGAWIMGAYWFTSSTSFANPAVTIARAWTDTFTGIRPADVPAFLAAQALGGGIATLVARRWFP